MATRSHASWSLIPHPRTASQIEGVSVEALRREDGYWLFEYVVRDPKQRLLLPAVGEEARRDALWKHSCFELFYGEARSYREFNFSPSRAWAAYEFTGYRAGQGLLSVAESPRTTGVRTGAIYAQLAQLSSADVQPMMGVRLGLSAVIEETGGTKSYWALAHAPGPPDFHNPACFTATLPSPAGA